jgi:Tfp pilus assembly protein PilF
MLWSQLEPSTVRKIGSNPSVKSKRSWTLAAEIQLTLGGHSVGVARRSPPFSETSYEAYDLYLRGLYSWNQRTGPGFDKAAEYFEQAIHTDPNYARAYAALANTYGLMDTWLDRRPDQAVPQARAAALKALQLDNSLAEAHTALALIAERYDYDWNAAEKEFRLAIQLDPGYATAHQWYGEYLSFRGRFDEALAESERARQLDPMSLIIARDDAFILYRARQYDRAITEARSLLEMEPNFLPASGCLIFSYVRKGQFSDALEAVTRYVVPNDREEASVDEAVIYGVWGRSAQARRAFADLKQCAPCNPVFPEDLLRAYVAVGQTDKAMSVLESLYAEHSPVITILKTEPGLDPLRSDPRFLDLLHRVKLDQ